LADALIAGGLPVAEITFRTDAARTTIEAIAKQRPDMLVGSGTVLTVDQVDQSLAAGARFALSPGIDTAVLSHAAKVGLPFAPGIMTPTDLQAALRMGCKMVKFFPAMPAGGPNMLKNIAAPYAHTGIGFNPTGGVTMDNLGDWLALPEVRAVGGTWIATKADIAAGNWDKITANAKAAVARVAELRAR
jgi:2-dehydro-3-deoxyphosphogluconate aldolase/(4S)-4-hydroxy-2-oxoglutarate aldolase